jgi:hypothetical protein
MTTVYKTPTKNNKSALVNRLKDYFEVEFIGILKGRAKLTKVGEYKTANYQDAKKMADRYLSELSVSKLQAYKNAADNRDTTLATNKIRAANKATDYFTKDGRMSPAAKPKVSATKPEKNKNKKSKPARIWDSTQIDDPILNESKNTPYVKPFNDSDGNHKGWKASNKHGKLKFFGKEFKASAHKHAGIPLNEGETGDMKIVSRKQFGEYVKKMDGNEHGSLKSTSGSVTYHHHRDGEAYARKTNSPGKKVSYAVHKRNLHLLEGTLEEKVWFDKRSGDKTGSEHVDKHKKILRKNLRKNRKRVKAALGMNEDNKKTFSTFLNEISGDLVKSYMKKAEPDLEKKINTSNKMAYEYGIASKKSAREGNNGAHDWALKRLKKSDDQVRKRGSGLWMAQKRIQGEVTPGKKK